MRVAWLGPVGDVGGGATLGALVLECALKGGIEVDLFVQEDTVVPNHLLQNPRLRVMRAPTWWRWGKWYSRHPMIAFVSSMIARPQVHKRLCDTICSAHASRPYDCLFQNSQIELFNLRKRASELPPIVVYPGVHAFGELRWHRLESAYARQSEGLLMHYSVRAMLMYRSYVQRRDVRTPVLILGLSKRFNELLARDYDLPLERLMVIYHPIGSAGEPLASLEDEATLQKPMKLLYVSRISVRKGVDQLIELTKRLDDLHGEIEILVIGDRTMWSDYTAHLKDLNPRIARRVGSLKHGEMRALYDASDILLLPSMYEPGGLVVGEALSRGMSIVASDEVGSAEPIDPACCTRFPVGDIDAFERCTREAIVQRRAKLIQLRQLALLESSRHFAPSVIEPQLIAALERAAGHIR